LFFLILKNIDHSNRVPKHTQKWLFVSVVASAFEANHEKQMFGN
jgi:hypothetical protein